MSAAPLTCVTAEPIVRGAIARMPWHGGLRPVAVVGVTARGAVDVRPIAAAGTHWQAEAVRVPAGELWFLIDAREARRLELPAVRP